MNKTRREQLLQKILQQKEVDWIIIQSPLNIYYYTNVKLEPHERFYKLFIDVQTKKTILFVPKLDEETAKKEADVDTVISIADTDNPYEVVRSTLNSSIHSCAVEKNVMTLSESEAFQSIFGSIEWVAIDDVIMDQRQVKTESEIAKVKKAIDITEQGIEKTIANVESGMTEIEVKRMLEQHLFELGAEDMAFDSIVLTGTRSALPHGVASDVVIESGDFLLIDVGIKLHHYHSDITRTFIVGKANDKQKEIYNTVKEANEKAIEAVKVGEKLKTIDIAARTYIEERGYGPYFTHRTGHGLGIDVHEFPFIHGENEAPITNGLLFTIEPGIYNPEIGGVRIEDIVYVDEKGQANVLTSFPKELRIIADI